MKKWIYGAAAAAVILSGCGMQMGKEEKIPVMSEGVTTAIESDLINTEGETVGTVLLTGGKQGMGIRITAEGLDPGVKAIHVHEKGECTPPDFKSAGAHYNPDQKEHGFDN